MTRRPRSPAARAALGLVVVLACGDPGGAPIDAGAADAATDGAGPPTPPAGLVRYLTGSATDQVVASRAGIILMGGGPDVDAAFAWQRDRIGGGDVVVVRASGSDGYNSYLYDQIGGVDSVETLIVDTRALALDPYVRWTLDHAEAVFLAGGDQSVYVAAWDDTPVADALAAVYARGGVVGGTSAGCAFLAGIVYSARNGTVVSSEALADPFHARVTLERDVVAIAPLASVITDSHFAARDRMGRLLAFAARTIVDGWSTAPLGLGIDEGTALVIDETGLGTVLGAGAVYAVRPQQAPTTCAAGQPLAWSAVPLYALRQADTIMLPAGTTSVAPTSLSAAGGALTPASPY